MRFTNPVRTDLVISMTLAEMFLLLLFVIWSGYSPILRNLKIRVAQSEDRLMQLRQEKRELTRELNQAQNQIADLQNRLEFWRQWEPLTGNFDVPPTPRQIMQWRKEACRSYPKCQESNVLVVATVLDGEVSMELLRDSPSLRSWLGRRMPKAGRRITDLRQIKAFLGEVVSFYARAGPGESECRFDYRLIYGSKVDYYDGRELFERYFYPARIERAVMVNK